MSKSSVDGQLEKTRKSSIEGRLENKFKIKRRGSTGKKYKIKLRGLIGIFFLNQASRVDWIFFGKIEHRGVIGKTLEIGGAGTEKCCPPPPFNFD
jgi:hypothetical protein